MMRAILILFSLFQFLGSFAQYWEIPEEYYGSYKERKREILISNIKGSPYLDSKLLLGTAYFSDQDSAKYYMRYNIYWGEMEFLQNGQVLSLSNPELLDRIHLNYRVFKYLSFYDKTNKLQSEFMIELLSGAYSLYKQPRVEFKKAEPPQSSYHEAEPDRFEKLTDRFYLSYNGKIRKLPDSKKSFASIFEDRIPEISQIIKKLKIKVTREEDLIRLFTYLNEQ